MLRVLLFASLALVLCPTIGSAELASNVIDDFSKAGPDLANGISRTETGAIFVPSNGFTFVNVGTTSFSNVTYSANSGTLGGVDADFANGVSFSFSSTFGGPFTIKAFGGTGILDNQVGSTQLITSGPVTFINDFSGFETLRFEVAGFGAGNANLGGILTAIPEPTSLALFGVVVAGFGFRRRRR